MPLRDEKYIITSGFCADFIEKYVCWYVPAEVSKADIEDCELGELDVEWNIIEAE